MKRISWVLPVLLMVSLARAEEAKKLTEEEALQQLQGCQAELQQVEQQVQQLEAELQQVKNQLNAFAPKKEALRQEIEQLKAEIARYPSEYTVQRGDYLAKIAGMRYIYNNPRAWPRIYRANRDKIKDPNLIYPGWVLYIPHGIEKSIEVIPGDNLWKIAGFSWIYDNPRLWTRIYEANRDKIRDPDLIYPGQVLEIPRD